MEVEHSALPAPRKRRRPVHGHHAPGFALEPGALAFKKRRDGGGGATARLTCESSRQPLQQAAAIRSACYPQVFETLHCYYGLSDVY